MTTAVVAEQMPCPDCYVSHLDMLGPWFTAAVLVATSAVAVVGAIGLLWTCLIDHHNAGLSPAAAKKRLKLYLAMTVGAVVVGAATALLETVQGESLGGWWWALGSMWAVTAAAVAAAVVVDAHHSRTRTTPDRTDEDATVGQARS